MAKKKTKLNRKGTQPKRKYVKKHQPAIAEWDAQFPQGVGSNGESAAELVEQYKWKIDDAIRRFKKSTRYKKQKENYILYTLMGKQANLTWVPHQVPRIKDYEDYAVHYATDPDGKKYIDPSNLLKLGELAETAEAWSSGRGYITYRDISLMADALGRDFDEMLNYSLFEMKEAIHQYYKSGAATDEFGYVEVGRR